MSAEVEKMKSAAGKKKRLILIVILLIALLAGVIAFLVWKNAQKNTMEPNAVLGIMPGKTDDEIRAELARQVDEKTIAFSINAEPVYESGGSKGNILFENPQSNKKLTRLEVYRDDTEELIYETGLMEPGSYVPEAKLSKELKKGDYACTAYIYGYRLKTEKYLGKVAAGLTVHVLK